MDSLTKKKHTDGLKFVVIVGSVAFPVLLLQACIASANEPKDFGSKIKKELQGYTINVPFPADLDKLSKAVACAETSCGKDGTARKRLNLHGIMCWDKEGKRYPCYFKSANESHAAFKKIWAKPNSYYQGQFPDLRLATTWVCGPKVPTGHNCGHNGVDNPSNWLATVKKVYSSL